MKQKNDESPLLRRFRQQVEQCWPALKGSLALVYKPCIRAGCAACARGDKHPNYLLSYSQKGRRRCLYVPQAMVAVLKRALANGRKVERLLYEMGPALVEEYRQRVPTKTGPGAGSKRSRTKKHH